eukprot:4997569-Pyramimonas_sp.AAC.1
MQLARFERAYQLMTRLLRFLAVARVSAALPHMCVVCCAVCGAGVEGAVGEHESPQLARGSQRQRRLNAHRLRRLLLLRGAAARGRALVQLGGRDLLHGVDALRGQGHDRHHHDGEGDGLRV